MLQSEVQQEVMNMISVGAKGRSLFNTLMETTRKVSNRVSSKIANPSAGAESKGIGEPGCEATLMNFITSTELIRPINSDRYHP